MTASPARVSLWRYSPAIILFAIVIADIRQLSDADLWVHILSGRELLAHGSLPPTNIYSYSAPTFRWLHHEWLSEVILSSLFDSFGPFGLKLLKFICTAGTISFIVLAESETGAPAAVQAAILMLAAVILMPSMQFRPQLFRFPRAVGNRRNALPPQLARHGAAVARDSDRRDLEQSPRRILHWPAAMGVYGAATLLQDIYMGRGPRRGLVILAITAAAAASTLCTFLIPPARETWFTLIYSIRNPTTAGTITDWKPLIASMTTAPRGSLEQKVFRPGALLFRRRSRIRDSQAERQRRAADRRRRSSARDRLRRPAQYRDRNDCDRARIRQPSRPAASARRHRRDALLRCRAPVGLSWKF